MARDMLIFLLNHSIQSFASLLVLAFSSSSSPYFPYCFSPSHRTLVFANYLRFHFSVSQPKALRSRARSYLSELHRASCLKESHSSSCSSLISTKFQTAAANLLSSTVTGPDTVAYQMLKHLICSDMNLLQLHIFNFSWSLRFFSFI